MTGGAPLDAAVIGAGSWGTALAHLLSRNGHRVRLWSYEPRVVAELRESGENRTYLPGIRIPDAVRVSGSLGEVVAGARLVVSVSPAQFVAEVMREAARHIHPRALVVSASKGIETSSLRRMDEVLRAVLPGETGRRITVLSGPSFATEVAKGQPTAVVAASESREARLLVQRVFGSASFRVYTNPDVLGVELGGALKNVIALAAGVCAGLGFGHNTRTAVITRGLAEITRLGVAMGAATSTFYGLAGIGDLVLTCTGALSRNRTVGFRLGRGEALRQILGEMHAVAEGVATTPATHALSRRYAVEMPIVGQMHAILEEGKDPLSAVQELMLRDPRPEPEGAGAPRATGA
ncbi:MAG: NAD(P)-dependent glycerol-3-phosphate dehydrogenase [Gammaproteobacteria bacterium]|nr:NAD(P)-dependent glycerol-3-phosphate dehydrogenase [Gammaproteobacteria bacterium]MDE0246813.1 NAD(P)-dependent glycerol-3-phosphate dehydrogenase [Gammaproteobacteria bacterium]